MSAYVSHSIMLFFVHVLTTEFDFQRIAQRVFKALIRTPPLSSHTFLVVHSTNNF